MELQYLSFLKPYLNLFGEICGLNKIDIDLIEQKFNVTLPNSYKEFLSLFGKKSNNLLRSYYMEFPELLENRQEAVYALNFDDSKAIDSKPKLKNTYFFFGQWQGYMFYFFDCLGNDDPPVYLLTDSPSIEKYKDSFSIFIREEGLNPLLELIRKEPNWAREINIPEDDIQKILQGILS